MTPSNTSLRSLPHSESFTARLFGTSSPVRNVMEACLFSTRYWALFIASMLFGASLVLALALNYPG